MSRARERIEVTLAAALLRTAIVTLSALARLST
jgi:hypothetical protein